MGFYGKQTLLETICETKGIPIIALDTEIKSFNKRDFIDLVEVLAIIAKSFKNSIVEERVNELKGMVLYETT